MAKEVTNFARFYAAFNRLPYSGDREELKKQWVRQYTKERTDSLREVTWNEYCELCAGVERASGTTLRENYIRIMKQKRSAVLHQMQLYGVDTSNWNKVDAFCMDSRIAGKVFRQLDGDELDALLAKMRAIRNKKDKENK